MCHASEPEQSSACALQAETKRADLGVIVMPVVKRQEVNMQSDYPQKGMVAY